MAKKSGAGEKQNFVQVVWPVIKRLPAYACLGLALAKEPSIPRRHKMLLYTAAVYTLTPLHYPVSVIPVVGQIDSPVLLLAALRDSLAHCPPEKAEALLKRYGLRQRQLEKDLSEVLRASGKLAVQIGQGVSNSVLFTGRLARAIARRALGVNRGNV